MPKKPFKKFIVNGKKGFAYIQNQEVLARSEEEAKKDVAFRNNLNFSRDDFHNFCETALVSPAPQEQEKQGRQKLEKSENKITKSAEPRLEDLEKGEEFLKEFINDETNKQKKERLEKIMQEIQEKKKAILEEKKEYQQPDLPSIEPKSEINKQTLKK